MPDVAAAGARSFADRREPATRVARGALAFARYLRRNPTLGVGILILLALGLFVIWGHLFYDVSRVEALSVPANRAPDGEFPLGTDRQGRDILAVIIVGTPLTLRIGLIAGMIGIGLGMVLAFVAAYSGGWLDELIRTGTDVMLTVPQLLVLVLIAVSVPRRRPHGGPDGAGGSGARLALAGAHHSLAGAGDAREILRPGRQALRHRTGRHHLPGDDAQPGALHRRQLRQRGGLRNSLLHRGWRRWGWGRWTRRRSA